MLDLRVGGRMIRTTAEHPFWVEGRGWTAAGELVEGDRLRTLEGWVVSGGVSATGELATVYNIRVEGYHTYFVGSRGWGFGLWAHNIYENELIRLPNGDVEFRGMKIQAQQDISHMRTSELQWMMEHGTSARTELGETVNMHHVNQNPAGPFWEIPRSLNNVNDKTLHPFGNAKGMGLTNEQRKEYNSWRTDYWRARASEELARRNFEQNGVF